MPNNFCRYLTNGYSFTLKSDDTLTVKPCCWFAQEIPVDSAHQDNRKKLFESITDWSPACNKCFLLEQSGQQSLRQTGSDWVLDSEDSQDPVTIDIHLDNQCNAACVICNPYNSSLWAKEQSKLQNKKITIKTVPSTTDAIDKIVFAVSLEKVKYVKFFGGEPLFTDTHLKFLEHIPYPEKVTLHYTTNGSIYPNEEVLNVWKKFKLIIFAASIDGVEEQFDYVRWPLTWNKVSRNLLRIRDNKSIQNLMFRIEFTANFLNAYYFDRLESWVQDNLSTNAYGDKTDLNIHPCFGTTWDLSKMPEEIRNLIFNKYSKDHRIYKIVKNLSAAELGNWKNFVATWDAHRNNSWKTAFPDLIDCVQTT
jgi:sulfatase maturation enzyme AslB (radical SAM superfamily)